MRPSLAWAFLFALALPVSARWPQPGLDVDELVTRADVIVVGREVTVQDVGPAPPLNQLPGRLNRIRVDASIVIKGPRQSLFDYTAVVWGTDRPLPARSTDPSERIFFMRRSSSGLQSATDFYSSVVGSSRDVSQSALPIQAVVTSIAAVITDLHSPEARRLEAVRTLASTTSPDALTPLRSVLGDRSMAVRTQAAIVLVRKNDLHGLPIVDDLLTHPDSRDASFVQDAIGAVIVGGLKGVGVIPAAERWIASKNDQVRRAGAETLRNTGSNRALNGLAACLSDDDFYVRYNAVAGLAEITGQLRWRPDVDTFHLTDGARYLDHWKAWARARGLIKTE